MILAWLALGALGAEPVEERQVLAAVRAFAYDRGLRDRVHGQLRLGVVYDGEEGRQAAAALERVFDEIGAFTLHDRPVQVKLVSAEAFLASPSQVDVVLIAPGSGERVRGITRAAAEHRVLTAGFEVGDLTMGAALAVIGGGDQLRLVVDLDASRAAGAAFSSQLLQLAEIRR